MSQPSDVFRPRMILRGFDEDEIDIFYQDKWTRAPLDEAVTLDDPEGVVIVHLSVTLFRKLVMATHRSSR